MATCRSVSADGRPLGLPTADPVASTISTSETPMAPFEIELAVGEELGHHDRGHRLVRGDLHLPLVEGALVGPGGLPGAGGAAWNGKADEERREESPSGRAFDTHDSLSTRTASIAVGLDPHCNTRRVVVEGGNG